MLDGYYNNNITTKGDDIGEQELDDIKSLKANLKKNELTGEELEALRRDVKKIIQRREKEDSNG